LSIEGIVHNSLRTKELGIYSISRFYLFLIFFCLLGYLLFSTELVVFNRPLSSIPSTALSIVFLTYLFFTHRWLSGLRKKGLWMALSLHILFAINSVLIVCYRDPIVLIRGMAKGDTALVRPFVFASIILNIIIMSYLTDKRRLFT